MRTSGYDRNADDWYCEPPWCVDALLKVEPFEGLCWDPACGGGNIPRQLEAAGLLVHSSDIADRGWGATGVDFLKITERDDSANIICNPPYGIIQPWIDHALSLVTSKVVVLARLAFLEGQARREWFKAKPLARVWVSSKRISMPPGGKDVPAKGGTIAYAWFVFEHGHVGAPTLGWLP